MNNLEIDAKGFKGIWFFLKWILLFFGVMLLITPYIYSEIISFIYARGKLKEAVIEFCDQQSSGYKYFRLTKITQDAAEANCLYENSKNNLFIKLKETQDKDWVVIFENKRQEKGQLYWPFYI